MCRRKHPTLHASQAWGTVLVLLQLIEGLAELDLVVVLTKPPKGQLLGS